MVYWYDQMAAVDSECARHGAALLRLYDQPTLIDILEAYQVLRDFKTRLLTMDVKRCDEICRLAIWLADWVVSPG